ncbi:outer membrane lipoprotein-sorting protein [Sporosarcina sp. NCCP-2222]|uniref:LolA family protein n=1 Tax=Sporosarcina sp. NCCP-2222 TaxID=2935073 RepID=UPI0020853834|nr:sigma-E factor regulatory protein RseB domain-containing protein [Sporosarcina sp. NCCP-2222]GKV56615.1 outer membrane lipoprotein-sorting protein [Sporosarcina sp. NCCP-2222]
MNWIKTTASIGVMLFFAIGLAACSSEEGQFSPKEVINEALKEANQPLEYYGEYVMTSEDGYEIEAKEWVTKEGKRRLEMQTGDGSELTTAVNDGTKLSVYDTGSNTAMITEVNDDLRALSQRSPRQQAEAILEIVKDTHDLSVGQEEKIVGRDTFHIIAKPKDDKTLIGKQEMWIDKETWMVLKSFSESNGLSMTQEYTLIDFKPEITDDLFVLDIPEDATIEMIDEESMLPDETTLEEVKKELGAYYQIRETDDLKLDKITVLEGFEGRQEFSFDYLKDGEPAFSVSVFKLMPNVTSFGRTAAVEATTIRGLEGTKMDAKGFRSLDWEEDGLQYVVLLENPDIEFEEVEAYIEEMELVE